MKKVSENFELPLYAAGEFLVEKTGNRCAEFDLDEQAESAAHAINHADALAEALKEALSELDAFKSLAELDYNFSLFMEKAKATLASYLGEE